MAHPGDPGGLWPGPRPLIVGHRGAPHHAPPNTVEATTAAYGLGADAAEIDVRATADGHPVLHRDAPLDGIRLDELSLDAARRRASSAGT